MKMSTCEHFIVFIMLSAFHNIYTASSPVLGEKPTNCQDSFSLPAVNYSQLIEQQTKSVLYGPADRNLLQAADNDSISYEHVFGLNKCCSKKDKQCRKVQKRSLKKEYKKSVNSVPIFKNAVCQMKFVMNSDNNRIPENIMETKCSCDFPVNFKPRKHSCEPIVQYMTVFRRTGCNNDTNQYERAIEEISVACVLVKEPKKTKLKKTRVVSDE